VEDDDKLVGGKTRWNSVEADSVVQEDPVADEVVNERAMKLHKIV